MARERVTEPYTLPHQTGALEEHPDWATTDLSSLTCVYGKSAFARHPSVQGDPDLADAGRLRPLRDLRVLLRPLVERLRVTRWPRAWAGCCPATSSASSIPTPAGCSASARPGELAIKGPTLMKGYLGVPPEQTFDADGFFHTGDAGSVDADGFLHWEGRRTEMIKTGGANVSPAELEVQLRACAPVKLARVVGVPDPRLDQLVVACITAEGGRRGHRGEHPVVPPRAGGLLQGAQARPLLRRRRDPHDHQRHQGARRRPRGAGRGAPRRPNLVPTTAGDR